MRFFTRLTTVAVMLLTLVLVPVGPASGAGAASPTDLPGVVVGPQIVVEFTEEFTEEFTDEITDGVLVEPADRERGDGRPSDRGVDRRSAGLDRAAANEQAAAMLADVQAGWTSNASNASPRHGGSLVGSLVGGMSVFYHPDNPTPAVARPAIEDAVAAWNAKLDTGAAPVVVEVHWASFGTTSVLGFAGPAGFVVGAGLPTGRLYPMPLANVLLGSDQNGSAPEIVVFINSDLHASGMWHYGTSNPSSSTVDLRTVVIHEIGHGVGFVSSASTDSGSLGFNAPPFVYDALGVYQGGLIINAANIPAALTSGAVQLKISDTQTQALYVPGTWAQGTSFSHFNLGTPSLMTPALRSGRANRTIDGLTTGALDMIGWTTNDQAITPRITRAAADGTVVTVNWSTSNSADGLPADRFRIVAVNGGAVHAATTVPGTARTASVAGLSPNTLYEFRVVPLRNGKGGSPAIATVTTGDAPALPPPPVGDKALHSQIERVYLSHLSRSSDPSGLAFWLDQRAKGASLQDMIAQFQSSAEFVRIYGSLNNRQFVTLLYNNVLGRAPDSAGLAHWTGLLAGGMTRAAVTEGFVESAEYVRVTGTVAPYSSSEGAVRRLYLAFFGRQGATANVNYWVGQHDAGTPLVTVADLFSTSAEFTNRYGSVSDAAFVNLIYANVLGRFPDSSGFNHWTVQLASGASRGEVMLAFSQSPEFIKTTGTIP